MQPPEGEREDRVSEVTQSHFRNTPWRGEAGTSVCVCVCCHFHRAEKSDRPQSCHTGDLLLALEGVCQITD